MKLHKIIFLTTIGVLLTLSFSVHAQSIPTITMDKPIKDMTISELQAKIAEILSVIQQLQALIAQLQGGGVSCNFYRNLYPGISGSDVKCLQEYLNDAGHTLANSGPGSPGQETIYYGSLTRAAVKKWQDTNNIEQGAWWGYFGPKSQAIYNELAAIPGEQEEEEEPPSTGTYCGDNIAQRPSDQLTIEDCDGTDTRNKTCITQGYTGGTLSCNNDCSFNTSQCSGTGPTPTPTPSPTPSPTPTPPTTSCGDNIIQSPNSNGVNEVCDTTSLNSQTCITKGYTGGTLLCSSDCLTFNTTNCTSTTPPVNNAPILNTIGNKSVNENSILSFTISATDADGDELSYSISNKPSGASFNTTTRIFTWTPSYTQSGTYNTTFTVSDASLTDQETITITVNNVETGPVCGDGTCEGTETCSTCSADCGTCAPSSGFPTDYISYWKFDGDVTDETGTNNGIFNGDATTVYDIERDYSSDTNGYVLSLDGGGDYVNVADDDSLDIINNDLTILLWMKSTAQVENLDGLITKGGVGNNGYRFSLGTAEGMYILLHNGTDYTVWSPGSGYNDGNWHHLVFVVRKDNNLIFYKDGSYVGARSLVAGDFNTTSSLRIGRGSYGDFNGTIDDVIIFSRSLSVEEIQAIYNAQQYSCTGISKCSGYTDSDNCENNPCGVSSSCAWDGNNCLKTVSDTWYVRPFGGDYSLEDGSSYANAWDGLGNIVWGQVDAGDTIYICGLHLRTYTGPPEFWEEFTPGANGVSEDARITIRGDCPSSDQGIIWGAGIMAHELWVDEGNNTWSITIPPYKGSYWEDITADSWTSLRRAANLSELQATPGSRYSSDYVAGSKLYVHTSDSGNPTNRIATSSLGYNVHVDDRHYITWLNLEFYNIYRWMSLNSPSYGPSYMRWENVTNWYGGFRFRARSHHLEFINCDIAYAGYAIALQDTGGVKIIDAPNYVTVRGCKIHDISGNADSEGIGTQGASYMLIENNEFYNVGSGITFYPFANQAAENNTIRWNWIHDTHSRDSARDRGIELNTGPTSNRTSGNKIYGNIVGPGVDGVGYRGKYEDEMQFYNNICYECGISFYFISDSPVRVKLRNNISLNPKNSHIGYRSYGNESEYSIDSDYNIFYPISGDQFFFWEYDLGGSGPDNGWKTFAEWQALSKAGSVFDPNTIVADPIFVNSTGNYSAATDFRLQPTSPAIDAGIGVGLTLDYEGNPIPQGSGPDIGAYESGPSSSRISQTDKKLDNVASIISTIQSTIQDIIRKIQSLF